MIITIRFSILLLLFFTISLQAQEKYKGKIKQINIINWSHTDYGFTDHPLIVIELQKHFIDIALDYVSKSSGNSIGERFTWTIESSDILLRWWQEADEDRRNLLIKAIESNQIDVNIMPFNIHPFYNKTETNQLVNWMPEKLTSQLRPRVAIQNDVNGFPRAVARQLAGKGISCIWLGMNGRHPFPIPTMSRWKLSEEQEVWLWNGGSYWDGYNYFSEENWRTNQCEASDLMYRWPREGEIFSPDEVSVRKAHEICTRKLGNLEKRGYSKKILPITFSNQWRGDNDGPFWGIVDFVKKWNQLELQPALYLSTVTESMQDLINSLSVQPDTVEGEFGDWWAFGLSASPRELAAAREARYLLQGARSEVLGGLSGEMEQKSNSINRDICTFYEHTFASMASSSEPYSFLNQGTIAECNHIAYKAYELAKWQLAQRVRNCLSDSTEGIYVINTQKHSFSGWVSFDYITLRNDRATGVKNHLYGNKYPLIHEGNKVRFWADNLPANSINRFYILSDKEYPLLSNPVNPDIEYDTEGWPVSVRWEGMKHPLFKGDIGLLEAYEIVSGGWWGGDAVLKTHISSGVEVVKEETPYSVRFSQKIQNSRLVSATRHIEIYRNEPRVRIRIVYSRVLHPQHSPEVFYIQFPLPDIQQKIISSNGGSIFIPLYDNIPNTCNTFHIADAWVAYEGDDGTRIWSSRTSPLFSLGNVEFYKRNENIKSSIDNRLLSMVYNNSWTVNFPMEYSGDVICEYDLYWSPNKFEKETVENITDTYLVEPVVTIIPAAREDASYQKWINAGHAKK